MRMRELETGSRVPGTWMGAFDICMLRRPYPSQQDPCSHQAMLRLGPSSAGKPLPASGPRGPLRAARQCGWVRLIPFSHRTFAGNSEVVRMLRFILSWRCPSILHRAISCHALFVSPGAAISRSRCLPAWFTTKVRKREAARILYIHLRRCT